MRKRRFTKAQIVAMLRELDASVAATELASSHAINCPLLLTFSNGAVRK